MNMPRCIKNKKSMKFAASPYSRLCWSLLKTKYKPSTNAMTGAWIVDGPTGSKFEARNLKPSRNFEFELQKKGDRSLVDQVKYSPTLDLKISHHLYRHTGIQYQKR